MPPFKIQPDEQFRLMARREIERYRHSIAHTDRLVKKTKSVVEASHQHLRQYG